MKSALVNEHIYYCMSALAAIDGEVHKSELIILGEFQASNNLEDLKYHAQALDQDHDKCMEIFNHSFNELLKANDEAVIFELLHSLSELADADQNFHEKEKILIQLIRKTLGLDISIGKKTFEWNDDQQKVLDCSYSEKIIVPAPPGAGKTELIAAKVKKFIDDEDVEPFQILLISFTNSAVKEMQERIHINSIDGTYPAGINISTIDKKAFSLNTVYRSDYKITDGYEKNIEDFLEILKVGNIDFMEHWSELKHIFIDEAQDLVGLRKDVCIELIKRASPDTGISIFGDQCQQIYPWEEAEKFLTEEDKISLIDQIFNDFSDDFTQIELQTIHRTGDLQLIEIIEDMRADIYVYDNEEGAHEIKSPLSKIDLVKEKDIREVSSGDNFLFLFRSNPEAIDAAYNLISSGKSFRLKGTGNKYPKYIKKWLGKLIIYAYENSKDVMSYDDFLKFSTSISSYEFMKSPIDLKWRYIKKYASDGANISIKELRLALTNKKLPLEFIENSFGFRGPKLSTIHASKGTQADNVLLKAWKKHDDVIDIEESKVIFVGMSRAKKTLKRLPDSSYKRYPYIFPKYEIMNNINGEVLERRFREISAKSVGNPKHIPTYLMETGLTNDYNHMSIISNKIGYEKAVETQEFLRNFYVGNSKLKCSAARTSHINEEFYISAETEMGKVYELGLFNSQVTSNMQSICSKWKKHKCISPLSIQHLQIMDVASYHFNYDDLSEDEKKLYLTPFLEQQTFFYPVLYGLGPFRLHHFSQYT